MKPIGLTNKSFVNRFVRLLLSRDEPRICSRTPWGNLSNSEEGNLYKEECQPNYLAEIFLDQSLYYYLDQYLLV